MKDFLDYFLGPKSILNIGENEFSGPDLGKNCFLTTDRHGLKIKFCIAMEESGNLYFWPWYQKDSDLMREATPLERAGAKISASREPSAVLKP